MSANNEYGQEFLDSYLQAMGSAWHIPGEEAKLLANPTAYAIEKGLPVESGALVKIDRTVPESLFSVDQLVQDWTATPGEHILHIPAEELITETDLTDAELELVAGGAASTKPNINVNVASYVG